MDESDAIAAFAALAHSTRLAIIGLLARRKQGLAVHEIGATLRVRQSALSFHLGILARNDIVLAERFGRSIVYRLSARRLDLLTGFINRNFVPFANDKKERILS